MQGLHAVARMGIGKEHCIGGNEPREFVAALHQLIGPAAVGEPVLGDRLIEGH